MTSRENVIGFLQETAEYFRECRSNDSFASKAENHFLELQNAANEVAELLKEQEDQIKNRDESLEKAREEIEWLRGMLKEQEAAEPILFMDGLVQRFACGKCEKHLLHTNWGRDNYCSKCGQKVKWND